MDRWDFWVLFILIVIIGMTLERELGVIRTQLAEILAQIRGLNRPK